MSKKTVTQSKPAPPAQQPPAKSSASKPAVKDTPKAASKGSFDVSQWVKQGHAEEVVVEIKSAFDLFDTDQGGTIDTKGNF